jgi:STELLO glycosyltransferase-like protein
MSNRQAIVLTTINPPTDPVIDLQKGYTDWRLVVVGDNKTPSDWKLGDVDFFSIADQRRSPFSLARVLPQNHYCRKNIGYLVAISGGAVRIAETDDDNTPRAWSIAEADQGVRAPLISGPEWYNVYTAFTEERIWPRGFPLEHLLSEDSHEVYARAQISEARCPVQQFLAEGDPDVDALYRLTVGKVDHEFRAGTLILDRGTMVPFNSQSTLWFEDAFTYMYLPSFVPFRMTDIWRSFVAQVCLWAHDFRLAYHGRGVHQDRNEHNLMNDFKDELQGYCRNIEIGEVLRSLDLSPSLQDSGSNLLTCYKALEKLGIVPSKEIPLVEAWVQDLADIRKGR